MLELDRGERAKTHFCSRFASHHCEFGVVSRQLEDSLNAKLQHGFCRAQVSHLEHLRITQASSCPQKISCHNKHNNHKHLVTSETESSFKQWVVRSSFKWCKLPLAAEMQFVTFLSRNPCLFVLRQSGLSGAGKENIPGRQPYLFLYWCQAA